MNIKSSVKSFPYIPNRVAVFFSIILVLGIVALFYVRANIPLSAPLTVESLDDNVSGVISLNNSESLAYELIPVVSEENVLIESKNLKKLADTDFMKGDVKDIDSTNIYIEYGELYAIKKSDIVKYARSLLGIELEVDGFDFQNGFLLDENNAREPSVLIFVKKK